MNGKKTLFYTFTLLLCLTFSACSGFSTKKRGGDGKGDDGSSPSDSKDDSKEKVEEKCRQYKPDNAAVLLSSDLFFGADKNPFRDLINCIEKYMDNSLKPICDEEKELEKKLEESHHDSKARARFEERLRYLEIEKENTAEVLYEFAEFPDEIYRAVEEKCDTDTKDHSFARWLAKKIGKLTCRQINREIFGAPTRAIARKAELLCGSSLRDEED